MNTNSEASSNLVNLQLLRIQFVNGPFFILIVNYGDKKFKLCEISSYFFVKFVLFFFLISHIWLHCLHLKQNDLK